LLRTAGDHEDHTPIFEIEAPNEKRQGRTIFDPTVTFEFVDIAPESFAIVSRDLPPWSALTG